MGCATCVLCDITMHLSIPDASGKNQDVLLRTLGRGQCPQSDGQFWSGGKAARPELTD